MVEWGTAGKLKRPGLRIGPLLLYDGRMRKLLALLLGLFATVSLQAQNLAIVNARVYTDPQAQAMEHATVLIRDGKIAGVGSHIEVPKDFERLQCDSCVVMAGFWNAHVHFTEPKWYDAAHQPAEKLADQLRDMLTHSGFTTVVDTSSNPLNTVALRKRIESGEVAGPRIYTAGVGLYPPHGIPYYLGDLPEQVKAMLPQPETPAQAVAAVERNIAAGSDIVKLFTGSWVQRGKVLPMPQEIATAAAKAGHEHGQLVFAHPSDLEGTKIAMTAGVDVLAHAPSAVKGVDDALIGQLVAHHMAMIPTLKLFSTDDNIARIRAIVFKFYQDGGQLIFGTDTGYLTDYSMSEEYQQLGEAGLSWRDVLAMLTTNPAERFKVGDRTGRLATGMDGDVTVLRLDPATKGIDMFASVQYTVRAGKVIFRRQAVQFK